MDRRDKKGDLRPAAAPKKTRNKYENSAVTRMASPEFFPPEEPPREELVMTAKAKRRERKTKVNKPSLALDEASVDEPPFPPDLGNHGLGSPIVSLDHAVAEPPFPSDRVIDGSGESADNLRSGNIPPHNEAEHIVTEAAVAPNEARESQRSNNVAAALAVAIPVSSSKFNIDLRNRRVRIGLAILAVVIVCLSVSLAVILSSERDEDGENATASKRVSTTVSGTSTRPSIIPSAMPVAARGMGPVSLMPSFSPSVPPSEVPSPAPTSLSWLQVGSDIDGPAAGDWLGYKVAISADGRRIAAVAEYHNGIVENGGLVRVYALNGTFWKQLGDDILGAQEYELSFASISLSSDGSRLAYGFSSFDNTNVQPTVYGAGRAGILEFNSLTRQWDQLGNSFIGKNSQEEVGQSVCLSDSGNVVAVASGAGKGIVRIYEYRATSWVQLGDDIIGEAEGDAGGRGLAIDLAADRDIYRVAVGAEGNDGNGDRSGHARIYEYGTNSTWYQIGQDLDGRVFGDEYGFSLSLSATGDVVAVGSREYFVDGNGYVRVFKFDSDKNKWFQLGDDFNGENQGDSLGRSVSLSSNGLRIAIGADYHDGGGKDSGLVRVFDFINDSWKQVGFDLYGEHVGDNFGESAALTPDGSRLVVGAPFNRDWTGHVRVFDLVSSQ